MAGVEVALGLLTVTIGVPLDANSIASGVSRIKVYKHYEGEHRTSQ